MFLFVIFAVYKFEYTMRVCIFKLEKRLLEDCYIVYLRFGKIFVEYTLRVCIFLLCFCIYLVTAKVYIFFCMTK